MKNKRFIAGAQCPSCGQLDKIFTYTENEQKFRACVRCEFSEQLAFDVPPGELGTRVNRTIKQRDEEITPVRLMEPGKKSR